MFEKIEKLKQGKLDPNELLKSLSMDTTTKIQFVSHPSHQPDKVKVENQQHKGKASSSQNKLAVNNNTINNNKTVSNERKLPKKT